jgi:hypothetical protein
MNVSALDSGLQGIQRGLDGLRRDAHTIANAGTGTSSDSGDVTASIVNLTTDRNQVQSSAKVVSAVDQMIGSLLDVMA